MRALKKILINLTFSLLAVLITLVLTEVVFRLISSGKTPRWSDRAAVYFMPKGSVTLQDGPHSKERQPGTLRIAVLGDSFTFGPHLQYEDTFSKRLEHWLNLSDLKAEVINFGISGYSTQHQVEVLKEALKYKPDLVLLEITLNDPERAPLAGAEREKLFGMPLLKLPVFTYWKSAAYLVQRVYNTLSYRKYIAYFNNLFQDPVSYGRFSQGLLKLSGMAKEADTPLIATVFPLFDFPFDDKYPFLPAHNKAHEALKAAGIPYLDLLNAYNGIPPFRLQVIPGSDSHPNEIAHRIAGERILHWLGRDHLIDNKYLPISVFHTRSDLKSRRAPNWLKGTTELKPKRQGKKKGKKSTKEKRKRKTSFQLGSDQLASVQSIHAAE